MAAVLMARHRKPAYVTFTQKLDPQYWPGWDAALILSGDIKKIMAECVRRYEAAGGDAAGAWMIRHDRDTLADGTLKDDHLHGILQQGDDKLHCPEIDQTIGFVKSIVRSPNRGGRIENAQAYLIHAKDPEKHQYDVNEVVTVRGLDYVKIEAQHRGAWARRSVMNRKAAVPKKEWAELGDALVQKVLDGEVDELDILKDKTLGDIYVRGAQKVDLALQFRAKREMHIEVEKLRAEVFMKTTVWIKGPSRSGKTWLAEDFLTELVKQTGWKAFRTTAKNGPDDYAAEEILLLNEPSSKVMEWADFLVLLDPRHAGPISARYYNKPDCAPRVIIVAVSIDPVEFGFFMPGKRSTSDSLDQLIARLALMIDVRKVDDVPRYEISRVGEVAPHTRSFTIKGDGRGKATHTEQLVLNYGETITVSDLSRDEAVDVVLSEVARRSPDAGLAVVNSLLDDRSVVVRASLESKAAAAFIDTGCVACRERVRGGKELPMFDGRAYWCDHPDQGTPVVSLPPTDSGTDPSS